MRRRSTFIILLVLYLALVGWLCFGNFSNAPSVQVSILGIPTDKLVHFCMFLPFPLIAWGIFRGTAKKPWQSLVMVLCFFFAGCIFAGGTEIGQGFTKYRTTDPADFMADGIGLAIGTISALILDLRAAFRKEEIKQEA